MSVPFNINQFRIILLDLNPTLCLQWRKHIQTIETKYLSIHNVPLTIHVHNGTLESFPTECSQSVLANTTTILSPANSLAGMAGGFDKFLASFFSPGNKDWRFVEQYVRKQLFTTNRGYVSPRTARLVYFNDIAFKTSRAWTIAKANSILFVPTMRVPKLIFSNTKGNLLEVVRFVFDCTWEALCRIYEHNSKSLNGSGIDTIVLTGIGTGYGGLPGDIVAKSMLAAITIFSMHGLSDIERGLYTLKFLKEDYTLFKHNPDLEQFKYMGNFDPVNDNLDKLFTEINV